MRSRMLAVTAAIAILAAATATGCAALNPPGTKASSDASGTAKPGQVAIQTPGGGTVNLGGQAQVPHNFPQDLPLYTQGVKAGSTVSVTGGSAYTVQMVTGDTIEQTYKAYQEKLTKAGYRIIQKGLVTIKDQPRAFISFSKGKSRGLINIATDTPANGSKTQITVQVTVPAK